MKTLYLVADEIHFRKGAIEEQIVRAVQGGVKIVQLREKKCSTEEFLHLALRVRTVLQHHQIPLLINDRVDIAKAVGAQGVHLGQSDLSPTEARKVLGPDAIIGLSVESEEHIHSQAISNIDYFGVSAIFPTESKKNLRRTWGLEGLSQLRKLTSLPLVGIGGIHEGNLADVIQSGADGAAVISTFKANEDWKAKAELLFGQYILGRKRRSDETGK